LSSKANRTLLTQPEKVRPGGFGFGLEVWLWSGAFHLGVGGEVPRDPHLQKSKRVKASSKCLLCVGANELPLLLYPPVFASNVSALILPCLMYDT